MDRASDQRHGHDCGAGTVLDDGLGGTGNDGLFQQI